MIRTQKPILHNLNLKTIMRLSFQQYVSPFEAPQADFLDIGHSQLLNQISGCLKQKYLIPYQNNSDTATGILFGPHARPIICLPVEPLTKKGEKLSVHFLIDTAVPTTCLSEAALKALYKVEGLAQISSTNVNIWGVKLAVNRSVAHWQGINILGANFLRKGNFHFECSYNEDPLNEFCVLKKKH